MDRAPTTPHVTVISPRAAEADKVACVAPPSPAQHTTVLLLRAVEGDEIERVPSPASRASEAGEVKLRPHTTHAPAVVTLRAAKANKVTRVAHPSPA